MPACPRVVSLPRVEERRLAIIGTGLIGASVGLAAKHTEALKEARDEIVGELRDTRREIVSELQAQRDALFRILDRLPNGRQGGTAGA